MNPTPAQAVELGDPTPLPTQLRLGWMTDIHLDFVHPQGIPTFLEEKKGAYDALLISGDISNGLQLELHLQMFSRAVEQGHLPKVYLVLGNHDFYHSSLEKGRAEVQAACKKSNGRLNWLTTTEPVVLYNNAKTQQKVVLVGDDGWYDARLGNHKTSTILLNDWEIIKEFREARRDGRNAVTTLCRKEADKSAQRLKLKLYKALRGEGEGEEGGVPSTVVVVTHVPPFKDNSVYNGKISDPDWLPWFTSKVMGDALLDTAAAHSTTNFLVLCGHSHGSADTQILSNLRTITGKASYKNPEWQETITLP